MRKCEFGRRVYRKKSWFEKHENEVYVIGSIVALFIGILLVVIYN